ncbi:hypothetical protein CBR64_03385 [Cellulosimicrobium cellulans]|uniref:Uncharacterized protein n=1 Tax=Cellulosimicrobium cellulans TaxID=1710 RepID=A0A1Y0HRD4_CELCE|nr:hypothetical protein CBR64_03385 [Cellulosimicrobium cellulans]
MPRGPSGPREACPDLAGGAPSSGPGEGAPGLAPAAGSAARDPRTHVCARRGGRLSATGRGWCARAVEPPCPGPPTTGPE